MKHFTRYQVQLGQLDRYKHRQFKSFKFKKDQIYSKYYRKHGDRSEFGKLLSTYCVNNFVEWLNQS